MKTKISHTPPEWAIVRVFWLSLEKIMQYSIAGLFFVLPIAFSHLLYLIGMNWSFEYFGNYEGLKKAIVYGVVYALLVCLLWKRQVKFSRVDGVFLGVWSAILAVQCWFEPSISALVWVQPLYFGALFPGVLWGLFVILRGLEGRILGKVSHALVCSLFFVTSYTVVQLLGHDPITSYDATFSLKRAFSMLGNPNMLAGYVLLLLPFIVRQRFVWVLSLSLLVLFNIFASGSFSLALIAFVYLLWFLLRSTPFNRVYVLILLLIASLSILEIVGWLGIIQAKMLSLETRWALLVQAGDLFIHHPGALFVGFPADTLMHLLDTERISLVKKYIDDSVLIGNFHSLPIEIIARFGMIMFALVIWLIGLFWKNNRSALAWEVLVLFVLFSLVHMPEVTHFAILILGLAHYKTAR